MKFRILTFCFLFLSLSAEIGYGQVNLSLDLYESGFNAPVDIVNAGDDRLFIVEQAGRIRIIDMPQNTLSTPFLDIDNKVSSGGERGLLGLVFHPNYPTTPYFYIHYINNAQNSVIARYEVSSDPNIADANSELILMTVNQPFSNHNAGDLNFGPDGYLYIAMGDGGSFNDPGNRSQNPNTLLGKMLRIDVDSGNPYSIPADNPFVNDASTLDEIWHLGLRNPWRFSFDPLTGDMWIGDVGQDAKEEVNFQPFDSPGGENWGWRCYEADNPFILGGCGDISQFSFPVAFIPHGTLGCSITGGFVYRGSDNPGLYGRYIYTDFCSGRINSIRPTDDGGWFNEELFNGTDFEYSTFGLDNNNELYMAGINTGNIWKINDDCTISADVTIENEGCAGDLDGSITVVASGTVGQINYTWSTDEVGDNLQNVGAGTYFVTITDDSSCELIVQVDVEDETPDPVIFSTGMELLTQSGEAAFQWFLDGVPIDGATSDNYTPSASGAYQVQVTGSTGCIGISDPFNFVLSSTIDPLANGWFIAPNP
ncbi:MAG: PQQ-dependent sugar dehydrogenase, partial [Bacteroidota bacterium]